MTYLWHAKQGASQFLLYERNKSKNVLRGKRVARQLCRHVTVDFKTRFSVNRHETVTATRHKIEGNSGATCVILSLQPGGVPAGRRIQATARRTYQLLSPSLVVGVQLSQSKVVYCIQTDIAVK